MLPDEGEQPGPLVLPDGGGAGACDEHLVAVPVTAEAGQQVPGAGVIDRAELVTVLTTDVAPLAIRGPRPAGHHVTSANITVISSSVWSSSSHKVLLLNLSGFESLLL